MNKILLMAGVATVLFAANANALDFQQYVSVKGTYNDMSNKVKWVDPGDEKEPTGKDKLNDEVFGAGFAYGVKTGPVRTELEFNLHQDAKSRIAADDIDVKMKNDSVMLNAYYDINTGTKFTPYVGAGLGFSHQKVKADDIKKSSNEFAWQVGAGVSYAATDNISVDFGYRYVDNGSFTVSREQEGKNMVKTDFESESNEFYLGVRYAF